MDGVGRHAATCGGLLCLARKLRKMRASMRLQVHLQRTGACTCEVHAYMYTASLTARVCVWDRREGGGMRMCDRRQMLRRASVRA